MTRTSKLILAAALASGAVLLAACGGKEESASTAPGAGEAAASGAAAKAPSAAAVAEANSTFSTVCTACHGASGKGDGPGSAALSPKPRDYTDKAWQASVDDDYLRQIIMYGGAAVGKSPTMPGNPQLISKPEVVDALVAKVRAFGK